MSAINSRLRAGDERPDPVALIANSNKSFVGNYVSGEGFVLNPEVRNALAAKDAKNAQRIFPYLGGEEVNSSSTQSFDRYVINFGDMTLEEAARWPDLLQIVRDKVKPVRDKNKRETRRKYWWRFGETAPALSAALASLSECLVTATNSTYPVFALQPTNRIFSHKLIVFPFASSSAFATLQSRIHWTWTRVLSGSYGSIGTYNPSDCFETFAFPRSDPRTLIPELENMGKKLYAERARYMTEQSVGLTTTYNRLKDPDCDSDHLTDILHLRQLHEDLDRSVLAAFGWSDIKVPPFCPATDADRASVAAFEDTIIERLFDLNAERAAAEAKAAGIPTHAVGKPKAAKPPKKPGAPKTQTSMLDEE